VRQTAHNGGYRPGQVAVDKSIFYDPITMEVIEKIIMLEDGSTTNLSTWLEMCVRLCF
jgi:hypothetical protein